MATSSRTIASGAAVSVAVCGVAIAIDYSSWAEHRVSLSANATTAERQSANRLNVVEHVPTKHRSRASPQKVDTPEAGDAVQESIDAQPVAHASTRSGATGAR